ncbi:MAG: hypothetical protein IJ125_00705 [Atopobiaceae bacterium]|nr:hypothetical protein [Atopobiaceae bacterium]
MQRSGSQKALLVISVINIILSAILLLLGIFSLIGGVIVGNPQIAAEAASETSLTTAQVGLGGTFLVAGGISLIVVCILEIIIGILGLRASNDAQKIMPVWWLSLISLVLNVVGIIMNIVQGQPVDILSTVLTIVLSALIFWIANNIKREAGR